VSDSTHFWRKMAVSYIKLEKARQLKKPGGRLSPKTPFKEALPTARRDVPKAHKITKKTQTGTTGEHEGV